MDKIIKPDDSHKSTQPTMLQGMISRRRLSIAGLLVASGFGAIKIRKSTKDDREIQSGGLVYSTKMGWIDMGHATPRGAQKLLELVKNPEDIPGSPSYGRVHYAQDQGFHGLRSGVSQSFVVKKGMTKEEIEAVAFTIFIRVSRLFEEHQEWTDWISGSSYHEADLVGNILGFYRASRGYSEEDIRSMAGVLSVPESVIKHKDRSLQKNNQIGRIPCGEEEYCKYPAPFNQIRTIRIGKFYHGRILLLENSPRKDINGIKFIGYSNTGLERFQISDKKIQEHKIKGLLLKIGDQYKDISLLRKSQTEIVVYK